MHHRKSPALFQFNRHWSRVCCALVAWITTLIATPVIVAQDVFPSGAASAATPIHAAALQADTSSDTSSDIGSDVGGVHSVRLARAELEQATPQHTTTTSPETQSNPLNDQIRVLAGLRVTPDSEFFDLTQTLAWQNYREQIQRTWARYNEQQHAKVEAFRDQWLPASVRGGRDLLYPFAAADFLYADLFFPDARNIYLFGLEPLGQIPGRERMTSAYYTGVIRSTEDLLQLTFFRTKAMKDDFQQNGTVPLLGYFIVHRGHTIANITYLRLNEFGVPYQTPASEADGVRIAFKDGRNGRIRNVWYWRGDISNGGLAKNPALKQYIASLPQSNLYMKAASYLCYHGSFDVACTLFRDRADLSLQEDSGMPMSYYPEADWEQTFFGEYRYPVSVFTDPIYRQRDALRNRFATSNRVYDLPFRLGYHASSHADNLMLAIRKQAPAVSAATAPTPIATAPKHQPPARVESQSAPVSQPSLQASPRQDPPSVSQDQPPHPTLASAAQTSIAEQLRAAGIHFKFNNSGDIWVIQPTSGGRTQLIFISPDTAKSGGLETRAIWSIAYVTEQDSMAEKIAVGLLRDNANLANGAWEISQFMGKDAAIYRVKIDAAADAQTLTRALGRVSNIADRKEQQLTGTDDL